MTLDTLANSMAAKKDGAGSAGGGNRAPIPVVVIGALGKMGLETVQAVTEAPTLRLVARIDPAFDDSSGADSYASLDDVMAAGIVDPKATRTVLIDFTRPDVVEANLSQALPLGFDCVVGTTGLSEAQLAALTQLIYEDRCLFIAPNFAIGAVLMMQLAQKVIPYMPQVEVIEYHHDNKLDAPSGTAKRTAELLAQVRAQALPQFEPTAPGAETELPGCAGARGGLVNDIPVHSVRLPGYVAHQEVIFGGLGQTLTVRHDSIHRNSFMPGVVLACEKVVTHSGLVIGLENLMDENS